MPNNQLQGQIPAELGQLNRLRYINLSSNSFISGEIPETLSSCLALQAIDLSRNSLSGSIPEGFGSLLGNLSDLRLSGNYLTGSIPASLGRSSSLVSVVLNNNSLTGPIPSLLANSSSLQRLGLRNNHLSGLIPQSLFNSTSLEMLVLAGNSFAGSIPVVSNTVVDSPSPPPLQYLILDSNDLTGPLPSTLGNLTSLLWLTLGGNGFHGSIPTSLGALANLQVLDMTNNALSGTVPASIYNMSALTHLGMGINNLTGEIPANVGYSLPRIVNLIMARNKFTGQIPVSLTKATNLQIINLWDNALTGTVPLFGALPNLVELDLTKNQLEAGGDWSFLTSLTNCTQLVTLYLDRNTLGGVLPKSIGDLPSGLEVLFLSANGISGTIPNEIGRLKNLKLLYLDRNLLAGSIPYSLGHLPNMFALSLAQNKLSGQVPASLGNLSQLSELYLQENNLSGPIPGALGRCKNLDKLNLSCNSFGGGIPEELFTLSSLSNELDLSHNQLSGEIPLEIGSFVNLGLLNISNNMLAGRIPSTLGQCVHLESLHMEGNLLDGRIPQSLQGLRGLVEMDMSRNDLSGEIPEFFETFSSMKLLNLSFNDLEGPVPTGGIFQDARDVFVQGNKDLCSSSSAHLLQLPLCTTDTTSKRHRHTSSYVLKLVGFTALSLVLLLCFAVVLLKKRKKFQQVDHPSSMDLKKFTYAGLVKATNSFSSDNLVGSGKCGLVYKGRFWDEEHVVAIKVFKLDQLGAPNSFLAECEALRNTRHRNLVKVITACSTIDSEGHDFKAVILEYMSNGSLENWLYPKLNRYGIRKPLSLGSRIKIAADIACALDYLHNHCVPAIVHCDLKPSNVLLDDAMVAHLGDFGLAKLLHTCSYSITHSSSTSLIGPRGSIGYIAPEYGFGSKLSTQGDVYSYGITVLEMLTGKRPTDEMFSKGLTLHKFVKEAFPQKIHEVLDPSIFPVTRDDGDNHTTDEITRSIMNLLKIGISCSADAPIDRPTIDGVYAKVITIEETFLDLCH